MLKPKAPLDSDMAEQSKCRYFTLNGAAKLMHDVVEVYFTVAGFDLLLLRSVTQWASKSYLTEMMDAGVHFGFYQPGFLQSKLVVPLLTSFTKNEKKMAKTREKLKRFFEMNDETADRFMDCFAKFSPESIKNEYYTDLLTWLRDDIHVEGTKVHFIYANKMGEKYLKRYKKYFRDPEIREFDMQHEQWLFGGEQYTTPVLKAIDEFMELNGDGHTA